MSLEDAFYILGIVVMSISLILLIVVTTALIVIRNKVVHIQRSIEEKLSFATTAMDILKKVGKK